MPLFQPPIIPGLGVPACVVGNPVYVARQPDGCCQPMPEQQFAGSPACCRQQQVQQAHLPEVHCYKHPAIMQDGQQQQGHQNACQYQQMDQDALVSTGFLGKLSMINA